MFFSSLNRYHLPLFMINKVNVTLLRQFLGLYCLSQHIIRLTYDTFLISLLFRIAQNLFYLPLFMISKVNVTLLRQLLGLYCPSKLILLRQLLGLYCPSKLIIRLTQDVCFISVLFRILSSLNHIDLPLFMIN